jgi:hypothetical protein
MTCFYIKYKCIKEGGNIMTKKWWKAAGIRSIKTICQTAEVTIGTATVMEEVNWIKILSASILADILSILTSLVCLPEEGDE